MRILIVNVAAIALALEATGRVHTPAVSAHCRHQGALVNLLGMIGDRIHDLPRHQTAQNLVLTCNHPGLLYSFRSLINRLAILNTYESFHQDTFRTGCPMLRPSNSSTTFLSAVAPWDSGIVRCRKSGNKIPFSCQHTPLEKHILIVSIL